MSMISWCRSAGTSSSRTRLAGTAECDQGAGAGIGSAARRRRVQRSRSLVLAVASCLLLGGCGGAAVDGPIESIDAEDAEVCVPQEVETGRAVIALSEIEVTGDRAVVVTDVALSEAEGMTVIGFDFGDFDAPDWRMVGTDYETYGPSGMESIELDGGRKYVLKIGIHAEPEGGTAKNATIAYHLEGSEKAYEVDTRIRMRIAPADAICF